MHVVVLGAGYAGLTLARRLESSLPSTVRLTVVDESPHHLVQHEVHRVVRRPRIADVVRVPLAEVLNRAELRTTRVERVDADAGRVELADGETLEYDYAAVCLGAETAYYGLPGVEEHGLPLKRVSHAERIREAFLPLCETGGTAVVGGAGLSGVQIAGELAALASEEGSTVGAPPSEGGVEIVLLERLDSVAPNFPSNFQRAVREQLDARDIDVRTETAVLRAGSEAVETDAGRVEYDAFVWTGGIAGRTAMGGTRPLVRNDLRLNRTTFVLGDAARAVDADGEAVPASASAAIREARTVAENLRRLVEHDRSGGDAFEPRLEPYRFEVPGWVVSVGDGAVAQVGPTVLTGSAARAVKASVGAGYLGSVRAISRAADLVEEELGGGD